MKIADADFEFIRKLVREQSGIIVSEDKRYLVETRLAPLAERQGFSEFAPLVAQLRSQAGGQLHRQVVEMMTTNETYFFRDVLPFDALHQVILPTLAQSREKARQLTIWSAACSTGQEPYSIAMLVREHFARLASWKVRIIASDLSNAVLDRARAGRYNQYEISRGLPADLQERYFTRVDPDWQIKDELRRMVEFVQLNLLHDWPALPTLDVVFLRNVLIYFDVESKKRILAKVRKHLQPDGYLFLGGAETTMNLDDHFERLLIDRAGCYRLRQPAAAKA
jgi:chemotaxis protein methyltransferase CheR